MKLGMIETLATLKSLEELDNIVHHFNSFAYASAKTKRRFIRKANQCTKELSERK